MSRIADEARELLHREALSVIKIPIEARQMIAALADEVDELEQRVRRIADSRYETRL